MNWQLFDADRVIAIHDHVLNPGELRGHAMNKSLERALARVDHRLAFGMIGDIFDLAAAYCVAIATGRCFNDGNKRTAFKTMDTCLAANGLRIQWNTEEAGQKVISLAQGKLVGEDLAAWVRGKATA